MKISVNSKTVFRFPTSLVVNRFTAVIIRSKLKKEGIKLTRKQTALFIKELKRYKKYAPDWSLVEVEEHSGRKITIRI
jgi:hypothetical protein